MKAISRKWGIKEKDIEFSASKLFKEYIHRSVKYGMRKKDQVIYDQFINKTHKYINIENVSKILKKNKIEILQAKPDISYLKGDSVRKNLNNDKKYLRGNTFRQQYYWSLKHDNDDNIFRVNKNIYNSYYNLIDLVNKNSENKNFFNNRKILTALNKFNFFNKKHVENEVKLIKENSKFFNEISTLLRPLFLKKNNKLNDISNKILKSKKLFKNTAGLTLSYFLCKKNRKPKILK